MLNIVQLVLIAAVSWTAPGSLARTWTDSTGENQVEAELLMWQEGKVWLRRLDGKAFEIALTDLSRADQEYVRRVAREKEAKKAASPVEAPERISYGEARRLADLSNRAVDESSGIAAARGRAGLFWTHNDSGGDARVYLFDSKGRDRGSCVLIDVLAYDWEDIVSFTWQGKHHLLLCDTGNNGLAASVQMLHLVEEPPIDLEKGVAVEHVPVVETIYYSYEDDHRNCEAVAVDPSDRTILLATKQFELKSYVYALRWPKPAAEKAAGKGSQKALVARLIATPKVPLVTGMDVSPDGRRAVLVTYANAYEFVRKEHDDWAATFSRQPREIPMPLRIQGESICYGVDGKTLYLTSEKLPTPLWEVPVVDGPSADED